MKINSLNEDETMSLGENISRLLCKGDIICLYGDLGSGKTTFVKGLAKGLNVSLDQVNSPSYVLLNIYDGKHYVYHFDLYRLDDLSEIATIGYEEFLYGEGVTVIEWADKLKSLLPKEYLKIQFNHKEINAREIVVSSVGERYKNITKKLK